MRLSIGICLLTCNSPHSTKEVFRQYFLVLENIEETEFYFMQITPPPVSGGRRIPPASLGTSVLIIEVDSYQSYIRVRNTTSADSTPA